VKIERIRVDSFGRITDFDTGPDPLGSLVVVLGPNEAGKSTLFSFLTTALYGFQPASRERNPHVPWGADQAGGSIQISLAGAGCADVERRLRSAPSGTLRVDGRDRPLRNQPLPWVEHVPRTVFRQVFAVTLSELAGLDEETWARIQDRVLGSMGATDLRPPRSVAEELEREAGEIWRPNRRGHQRLRILQEEVRALRGRRTEALARDQAIRGLIEEGQNLQVRMQEVREERQRDRIAVERLQELGPLKRQFDRIEELRSEGGEREDLAELPDDPRAQFDSLETEAIQVNRRLEDAVQALEGPTRAIAAFSESDKSLLSREDEIRAFLRRATSIEVERTRAGVLKNLVVDLEYRARTAADHLVEGEFDSGTQEAVSGLSVDLLRDRVQRLRSIEEAGAAPTEAPRASAAPSRSRTVAFLCAATGGSLLGWAALGGPQALLAPGAALFAIGATLLIIRHLSQDARAEPSPQTTADTATVLERDIQRLLDPVSVRAEYVTPPGDPLVAGVERLQELIRDWQEKTRAYRTAADAVDAIDDEAHELSASLGYPDTSNATELSARLERDLHQAESRHNDATRAGNDLTRLGHERDALSEEHAEVQARRVSFGDQVSRFGDGSVELGLATVQKRIEAHLRADRLESELSRTYPDLAALKARVEAMTGQSPAGPDDDRDVAELKARLDEFDRQIDELMGRSGAIERETAHLREKETVDAVDGEVASLQEAEARLVEERDRKWVLAQLLREADRRFREEHQPDLLRRASSYLEHLTGGRYDRLLVDEQSERDLFQLVGPAIPAPIPLASPISTGTLEQAYLSLRLAIVDHLDQGSERLPLFIDEAFVNWDAERRDRGLEVLASLAETRQVFAFTCHPEMAQQLAARGGRILHLERDG
jgi:uncharacterized protein YhaN